MSRIRSIHPSLFTDEAFMSLTMPARMALIGLWCEADDHGIFEWKPVTLKARLFPADNIDFPALLSELEAANVILAFKVGDKAFGAIRNFCKYQKPRRPHYQHPLAGEVSAYVGSDPVSNAEIPDNDGNDDSPSDPIPDNDRPERRGEERREEKKEKEVGAAKPTPRSCLLEVLDEERAQAVLDHRQRKRSPLTTHGAKLLAQSLAACGDPNRAADLMIEKGWASIKPDWFARETSAAPTGPPWQPPRADLDHSLQLAIERQRKRDEEAA